MNRKDYYFHVAEVDDGEIYVCFVPISFWKENQYMDDQVDEELERFIPDFLDNVTDATYVSSKPYQETVTHLLNLEFVQNDELESCFLEDMAE